MAEADGLPLSEALASLRRELKQAIDNAQTEDLRFKVDSVEVELQVVATASGGASAGVNIWHVIQVGGHVDNESAATHRVKLSLSPVLASGADAYVNDTVSRRPR